MSESLERMRSDLSASYASLCTAVGGLLRRGETLERLTDSTCDLERASEILRRQSWRATQSRTQLSLFQLALGCAAERPCMACAVCSSLAFLVYWSLT